jgi:hypothetical protein
MSHQGQSPSLHPGEQVTAVGGTSVFVEKSWGSLGWGPAGRLGTEAGEEQCWQEQSQAQIVSYISMALHILPA